MTVRRCDKCRSFKARVVRFECSACGTRVQRCEGCGGFFGAMASLFAHVRWYASDPRVKQGPQGGRFHRDYLQDARERLHRTLGRAQKTSRVSA